MKTDLLSLPGYNVNEYLLVLNPHEELRNKIRKVREEFAEQYNMPSVKGMKSHLTLLRFKQRSMMEERIVQNLKRIAMGQHAFKVELKDFGSFPTHSIHIQVPTRVQVKELVGSVKQVQHLLKMDKDNKPYFLDEPFIPVARKLLPWQYEKGWLDYSHRSFTGRFIADHMLLLKRREGDMAFQIAARFDFLNLPVLVKQGALFA
jgi:2'-5' RNA ligase